MNALLSPVDERTGLIRWVFDIPIEPGEPTIFNASVKMADTSRYSPYDSYDNNGGSGLTRNEARQAAIGEGLERYCCAIYGAEDLVFASVNELRAEAEVCLPSDFALFHPDQLEVHGTPDDDTRLAWTSGWWLSRGVPVLVPACLVYMPYFPVFPEEGERVFAPSVSTGLACARSLDQSVLGGVYELVERDSFMVVWNNRLSVPRVEIESHPKVCALYRERLQRDGLRYELFCTTSDLGVPSYLCLLVDERRSPPMLCAGGAAHLDPVRAASKAMLEAVQTREWAKFLGRQDRKLQFEADFSDVLDFEDHVALYAYGDMLHAAAFLLEDSSGPTADWDSLAHGDPTDDLGIISGLLASSGLDILAVDLTTPDVAECGCVVTRALVPQLQPLDASHQHRFLGGDRLYSAPQRMGYSQGRTTLHSLNPYPHPYP